MPVCDIVTEVIMSDQQKLLSAQHYVKALKGFYIHAVVFGCVMTGLAVINLLTKTELWVHWPLLGWGAALVIHGISIFAPIRFFDADWEKRQVERRLQKSP
jgi:2TM domain